MSLQTNIDITLQNRKAFKKILDSLSIEDINKIPNGFNNNIIWNVAHCLSVQQTLINKLSGQAMTISDRQVAAFYRGTKPEQDYNHEFVDLVKAQLFSTIEQLQLGIEENKYNTFTPFMTAIKVEINNIDSAIAFNQYHEALHMGYILNILRFLK
ncbi:MAG: DinB family protein [Saprospiraceae bacterium]|nr:DinB family protein [Saprospiraceae bacterium]